ncbi:restriction endonuclease subunit S [Priestia megaterium]|uniref:restriction endonuclease subunit S n=1 Tax=Priestia megaterium TaxID=1404 RepID=UPI0012D9EBC7|nr:restriction endonuclease subunit S [Priestia megaterium]MUL33942.1 EcoKI restriction-modification system protein HsdS [Priestia megaterium]
MIRDYNVISNKPEIVWVDNKKIDVLRLETEFYRSKYVNCLKLIEQMPNMLLGDMIEDVKDGPGGWGIKASEYVNKGVPMLRGVNIVDGLLSIEDCVYISEEKQKELKRSKVVKDDVLLVVRGSIGIGKSAVYSKSYEANMNAAVVKLTFKNDLVDPYYVSCFFNSRYGRLQTERIANGVNQQNTNLTEVRSNRIPLPSRQIQKYIGDKVRRAEELRDEAIRVKAAADKELEDILEFKKLKESLSTNKNKFSWVQSKKLDSRIDGEFYKKIFNINNEHIGNLDKMGIKALKLKDILKEGSYGILPSSNDYGSGQLGLLRSTNLKEFLIEDSYVIKVPESYYKEKIEVKKGDILLEIKGACYTGAIVEEITDKQIVNGSIYRFSIKEGFNNYYVLAYLLSESGQLQKQQNLANSIISYLSLESIKNLKIPIIPEKKQQIIGDMYKKYVEHVRMSKYLIQQAKQDVENLLEGNLNMSKVDYDSGECR